MSGGAGTGSGRADGNPVRAHPAGVSPVPVLPSTSGENGKGVSGMAARKPAANRQSADLNLTFLVAVMRRSPQWAVWLPRHGQWVAVRGRDKGLPSVAAELIWVQASSASQLCAAMQQAERRLRAEAMRRARELARMGGPS